MRLQLLHSLATRTLEFNVFAEYQGFRRLQYTFPAGKENLDSGKLPTFAVNDSGTNSDRK